MGRFTTLRWLLGLSAGSLVPAVATLVSADAASLTSDIATLASDDEVFFWADAGEGKDTIYTRSLHSAAGPIRRIVGDGDAAPDGGTIAFINLPAMNDREEIVFYSRVIGGLRPLPDFAALRAAAAHEQHKPRQPNSHQHTNNSTSQGNRTATHQAHL